MIKIILSITSENIIPFSLPNNNVISSLRVSLTQSHFSCSSLTRSIGIFSTVNIIIAPPISPPRTALSAHIPTVPASLRPFGMNQMLIFRNPNGNPQKIQYPEVPPRVEYALSEVGESMRPILTAMQEWETNNKESL